MRPQISSRLRSADGALAPPLRCPVCHRALVTDPAGKVFRCHGGHPFDRAREGYVNLLVTHQRRARPPGDSDEMVRSRRAFLERGHYGALADALVAAFQGDNTVADVGCGEGWFTAQISQVAACVVGIDIAKLAVRLAARRDRRGVYVVASAYDLPILDHSVDRVLSVFAPIAETEFARVLTSEGAVIAVSPGRQHLAELRQLIYASPEAHDERVSLDASQSFRRTGRERVTVDFNLDGSEELVDLVRMTPYWFYLDDDARARLRSASLRQVTADFIVSRYALTGDWAVAPGRPAYPGRRRLIE